MSLAEELRKLPACSASVAENSVVKEMVAGLPEFDFREPLQGREPDYYGASHLIAEELGLPVTPVSRSGWVHGWGPFQQWKVAPDLDPAAVFGPRSPKHRQLLNTEEQVAYVKRHGWADSHAVGAPFTYTRPSGSLRVPGSLLVMPPHVTATTLHEWDEDDYVGPLALLKDRFSVVVACVSAFCIEKGYWISALDRMGIPWVMGTAPSDRNGLNRMRMLFDSFEFVTSNQLGSLHAYAAFSGAKASVWGPELKYTRKQFENDEMWKLYPEGLEVMLRESTHERSQERFPSLFCLPDDAIEQVDWARDQLGWDCRRAPAELARLLGWRLPITMNEDDLRLYLHSFTGVAAMKIYRLEQWARKVLKR